MQTKLPWLCALLLGVIGWVVGRSTNDGGASGARRVARKTLDGPSISGWQAQPLDVRAAALAKDFEHSATTIIEDPNYLRQAHRLYEMVGRLEANEMPAALNAALHLEGTKRFALMNALLSHWAELDPQAAVQYASSLPDDSGSRVLRSMVLGAWGDQDFAAATAYALDLAPGKKREEALGGLAIGLGRKEPGAALQFIERHIPGSSMGDGTNLLGQIMQQWAQKDLAAAAKYAVALADRQTKTNALSQVAFAAIHISPQDALKWAQDIPERQPRDEIMRTALFNWSQKDPQAVLQYAQKLPPGSTQEIAISNAITQLAAGEIGEARRLIEELPATVVRTRAITSFVSALAVRDQKAAVEYALSLPEGEVRLQAISSLAGKMAERDPAAALDLANTLPEEQRNGSLQQISWRWAHNDPQAAVEYLTKNSLGVKLLSNVVDSWSNSDPEEAFAWVQKMPEGKQKNEVLPMLFAKLAEGDPLGAAERTLKFGGAAQAENVAAVARCWANLDPLSASAWVVKLPENETRSQAASSVIASWSEADPVASAKWLDTLPAGGSRDSAVGVFARSLTPRDPESAATWAGTIADADQRQSAIENVVRNWIKMDRAAARVWISRTMLLADDERQSLLRHGKE